MKTNIAHLTVLFLLFCTAVQAQTSISYYVDGSAAVNGTGTQANPFNKIAYAVFPARDTSKEVTIFIKRGVYTIDSTGDNRYNLVFFDANKSSDSKLFTFKTYPGDEGKVVIDGSKLKLADPYPSLFIISRGKNVRIQDIVFSSLRNTMGTGVQIFKSQNVTIANCRFDTLQWTSNTTEQGYPTARDTSWQMNPIEIDSSSSITILNDTLSNSALGWGSFVKQKLGNANISTSGLVAINNTPVAVNYYVSLTGNDTTGTGSIAKPWRTGRRALQLAGINYTTLSPTYINAPVSILYRAGTHKLRGAGLYIPDQRGQNGQWLTIRNYPNENAILDGSLLDSAYAALISVAGAKNVRIEGLKLTKVTNDSIRKDTRFGIIVSGKAANIIIKKNEIYDMAWTRNPVKQKNPSPFDNLNPLVVLGTTDTAIRNVIIDSNTVYNNVPGYAEAVTINGNVDSFSVTNNLVFDNANIGIVAAGNYPWVVTDPNYSVTTPFNFSKNGFIRGNTSYRNISPIAVSAGIYLDGSRNVLVENNLCYQNGTGISIGNEPENSISGYHTVRSNVLRDNLSAGLYYGSSSPGSWVENCVVKDNTIKDNFLIDSLLRIRATNPVTGTYAITLPSQRYTEVYFKRVRNSIFEQNTIESLSDKVLGFFLVQSGLTLRYNTYYVITENACQAVFVEDKNNDGIIGLPIDSIYFNFHQYAKRTGYDQNSSCEGQYYSPTGCGMSMTAAFGGGADEVTRESITGKVAITAFPNPVVNTLLLKFKLQNAGTVTVQLMDLSGKVVLNQQQRLMEGIHQLTITNIRQKGVTPGIYMLKVITPDESKTMKIAVQ